LEVKEVKDNLEVKEGVIVLVFPYNDALSLIFYDFFPFSIGIVLVKM
jgi:hypothetical protein